VRYLFSIPVSTGPRHHPRPPSHSPHSCGCTYLLTWRQRSECSICGRDLELERFTAMSARAARTGSVASAGAGRHPFLCPVSRTGEKNEGCGLPRRWLTSRRTASTSASSRARLLSWTASAWSGACIPCVRDGPTGNETSGLTAQALADQQGLLARREGGLERETRSNPLPTLASWRVGRS
jgi:hypothetical protein